MKKFTVDGTEYKLEFSFEAAMDNDCVQNMFNMLTGAYIYKSIPGSPTAEVTENMGIIATVEGFSRMFADTPKVCCIAFRAGLRENHPELSEKESRELMKRYMKNKKFGFNDLFNDLVECMEKDGFFKLTNLDEAIKRLTAGQGKDSEENSEENSDSKTEGNQKN